MYNLKSISVKATNIQGQIKHCLMLLITICTLTNCSSIQSANDGGPSALAWKNGLKGEWALMRIEKADFAAEYTVKSLFEEAPPECFLESVWNLPGNGMGSIQFTSAGRLCAPGAIRNIQWSISKDRTTGANQFQIKKIYPGDHPKHVLTAYHLDLAYADDKDLRMVMNVPLTNGNGKLIFHFKKL
jgi:hypothetical protein